MSENDNSIIAAFDLDDNIVFVYNARKHGKYRCPQCKGVVTPVMGTQYSWHFRHASLSDCKGAGETMLHYHAKFLLLKMLSINMPPVTYRSMILFDEITYNLIEPIVEPTKAQRDNHKYKPDLIATLKNGTKIWIEVTVTSKTDGLKLEYLRENKILAIEYDLSTVGRLVSKDKLQSILERPYKRLRYLSHPLALEKKIAIDKLAVEKHRERELQAIEDNKKLNNLRAEQREDMNKKQAEYKKIVTDPNITEEQRRKNHSTWIQYAQKKGLPYISYDEFMNTDFEKLHKSKE
jgi:hypothetical protein